MSLDVCVWTTGCVKNCSIIRAFIFFIVLLVKFEHRLCVTERISKINYLHLIIIKHYSCISYFLTYQVIPIQMNHFKATSMSCYYLPKYFFLLSCILHNTVFFLIVFCIEQRKFYAILISIASLDRFTIAQVKFETHCHVSRVKLFFSGTTFMEIIWCDILKRMIKILSFPDADNNYVSRDQSKRILYSF